jgi:polyphosphate kinase
VHREQQSRRVLRDSRRRNQGTAQAEFGVITTDGKTAREVYRLVCDEAHALVKEQYALLNDEILPPSPARESISSSARTGPRAAGMDPGFLLPRSDAGDHADRPRPVAPVPACAQQEPQLSRSNSKAATLSAAVPGRPSSRRRGCCRASSGCRANSANREYAFVFLSSILHEFVHELFAGMKVLGCYQFRVTRNSDLFVDEEEVKNLRAKIQGELPQRHFGDAVRLEVANSCSEAMTQFLLGQFNLTETDLYRVAGPVNLVRLMQVPDWVLRNDLKFQPFAPGIPKALQKCHSVFDSIRGGDILLHHPYQSFNPVIELLEQSANDPQVVAIKMTVYRTGTDSVLMQSLLRAAQNGKEVTVVVELMARFDEEANIGWATKLEEVGAHVVYGVVGYKTHAKMLMIVRREEGKAGSSILRRYVHLGTGNYHPKTARLYSDFGLLTCNEEIGADTNEVFKQLTGLGRAQALTHLWQAPFTLQPNVVAAIRAEAEAARAGKRSRIIAKMNSLLEPETIATLYEASQAGVKIDLIVRGVCGLRAGVKGLSENISVRSIIGRQLEHHRVFYFYAGGEEKVYLSSADWMERNFFRRIELAFPVLDRKLKRRVIAEGLQIYLTDNTLAWELGPDGTYHQRRGSRTSPHSSQAELIELLQA